MTDSLDLYDGSLIHLVGYQMVRKVVEEALAEAGMSVANVKVIELRDFFSTNEILTIDALGLSQPGKAHDYVRTGQITYGSPRAVINPLGGLIFKGHLLGATGLAQIAELCWQLRGWSNNRLIWVDVGQVGLQQKAGLGGVAVVTVLQRADAMGNDDVSSADVATATRLGYSPAVEAKAFTLAHAEQVRSKRRSEWALKDTQDEVQARF
jgi:sterol carrier protein 2